MRVRGTIRLALAATALLAAAMPGLGQVAPNGMKTMGEPAEDHLPDILNTVKIDQRLGQQLPLGCIPAQGGNAQQLHCHQGTWARSPVGVGQ